MGAESSTMQNATTACKGGCKNLGNKHIDTVKLDMGKLNATGKENSDPGQMRESPAQKNQCEDQKRKEAMRRAEEERKREEEQRQRELEEVRKQQEQEKARAEEARRVELARIAAEEKRRQAAAEEERLRRIQEEEEVRQRMEEEEEEERLRREKEAAAAAEALRLKEEEEDARKKERLNSFLQKAGFNAVSEKKVKKGMISSGFLYPLHAAVEQKDTDAIELLLWAGADPCMTNSKKLTPLKLAQAKNNKGSHEKVIAALAA